MELTNQNFQDYLPWVLYELTTSCFVALDLELSGIPFSPTGQAPRVQSLQERYAETKAAAEKYQVLQVGLTICHEDPKTGTYVLKPYNINVNPLVERGLNINRDWTFMSWSVEFLAKNHFSIDDLSKHGVRYLSRSEEADAMKRIQQKYTPFKAAKDDGETQTYLTELRQSINNWMSQGAKRDTYLNLPLTSLQEKESGLTLLPALQKSQRWFIHHLVNTEYPALHSRNKNNFVQIETKRPGDHQTKEGKLDLAYQRVQKHSGLRWLIEALVGGDLSGLDATTFRPILSKVANPTITLDHVSQRMKARLKEKRTVFVGHNCYTDLVFFYQCFLGALPETVEEFQARIHQLFPVLVDTKHLASHFSPSAKSSLEEVSRNIAKLSSPTINVDALHNRYFYKASTHQAGYDSMLTAVAFIRLSTLLHQGQKIQSKTRGTLQEINIGMSPVMEVDVEKAFLDELSGSTRNFLDFFDVDHEASMAQGTSHLVLEETGDRAIAGMVARGTLIPRLGSKFWVDNANRLQIFGTVSKVLQLGKTRPGAGPEITWG
ncbi:hypothetical protein N7492_001871 [Penicillium capsulatum]|uniref:Uncharacterized protein n=1 Tax=Penicillium capsulatum TaxID=69766 RepID=A0A9W9M093_9EURO|nr:hypothetical protein N7492_001871 [Penicillium capsulatum]KAJ6129081.1 hypothetical protein N7512_001861 [Penicillium capsulatum]